MLAEPHKEKRKIKIFYYLVFHFFSNAIGKPFSDMDPGLSYRVFHLKKYYFRGP